MKKSFALGLALIFSGAQVFSQAIPELGIASSLENDAVLYQSGFRLIGESVGKLVSPNLSPEQICENKSSLKKMKCQVYMCNSFFPGNLKIAGEQVDEQKVLIYADSVFSRAAQLGIKVIVLGSGGARRLPEGYNVQKAEAEFIVLTRKMALLAARYNVRIFLEALNSTETNFITTLKQAAKIVRAVNHPNFRLNADIYHMMKENEPPQHIVEAGDVIVYCEIAEKDERTYPGFKGDDFVPYLKALKKINYNGYIFIEGRWTDLSVEAPLAKAYLEKQLKLAYQK